MMLLNAQGEKVKSFQNDQALFRYLTHIENEKMLEDYQYFKQPQWSFGIYSPRDVYELYHQGRKGLVSPTLQQAYEQQGGMLEICTGDYQNPTEILITPGLDIERYQKEWCQAYCEAHEYHLMENDEGVDGL